QGGGVAAQCSDLENQASPGDVVFRITNQRAVPVYYDDNRECTRAFTVSEGEAPRKQPYLTGWSTCGWHMENDGMGPADCITEELSTLDPNSTLELTWDRLVFERRDLPAECRGGPDSPALCSQLVAIEASTLTVHLRFWSGQDCSGGECSPTGEETKEQTFSFPVAGPVDITID
ncbi:hypothetical protein, partial [Sorangium cellulosum]|uniref:hypothetical protein n=1 Tax=Sorangium cellulosum TaxID=56 RepID=UPI000A842812